MKADFGRTGVIKDPSSHDLKRFGLDFVTNYEFAVDCYLTVIRWSI